MNTQDVSIESVRSSLIRIALAATALAAAAVISLPSAASAQSSPTFDARWQPWIGCWKPAPPRNSAISFSRSATDAPIVCVVPSSAESAPSGVEVVTIADGKIAARDTIEANGRNVARSKDGCTGFENASWSDNGRRVYVNSNFTCPGGMKRTSAGMFAISPDGEWVNVQSVKAGGSSGVRTVRYTDAGEPQSVPTEITSMLRSRSLATSTARAAAGALLTKADIVEASHRTDSTVVEAWIVDRAQKFSVDAKNLVALADAGVPGNVTDAMVAVSYPKAFVVNPPSEANANGAIEQAPAETNVDQGGGRDVRVMMLPSYGAFGFSPFDYYSFGYSPYGYSPYGYAPYGYSPYGYSPYGGYYSPYAGYYGSAYGGVYSPPVIVLKGSAPSQRGYVVKGRGYTRSAPSGGYSGSTAEPRSTTSSPPPSAGSNSPPPPPPPSSGRTAHQRP